MKKNAGGLILGVCVTAAALCFEASARANDHMVVPDGQGARSYFAPMPPRAGHEVMTDRLQRALFDTVTQVARARGQTPPEPDARLEAFAGTLARALGPEEVPGVELQEFLLSHFGLGDPVPELAMLQVLLDDDRVHDKIRSSLPRMMAGGPFGRVGIGVQRRFLGKTTVVVALQRVDVEMLPIPRRLEPGSSAMVGGRLLRGLREPQVLVAPPGGMEVLSLPIRQNGDSFQTSFRCDGGTGRYQVEIVGVGAGGKTVVANFPVHCGVAPPRSAPRVAIGRPETEDRGLAEKLMLTAVNRDRAAVGLPALEWDDGLARAARAYSDEMAERQQVEHVSPRSGNAADRVRRAGARVRIVLENVGRANSVADAQKSFMSSPGHRANVLSRQATRFAAGVTIRKEPGGVPSLYVTQLFGR